MKDRERELVRSVEEDSNFETDLGVTYGEVQIIKLLLALYYQATEPPS